MTIVSHDGHVTSCDHSRTDDTDMAASTTRVADQMDNIVDIRCVTKTPRCVATCVCVTPGSMMCHIMFV